MEARERAGWNGATLYVLGDESAAERNAEGKMNRDKIIVLYRRTRLGALESGGLIFPSLAALRRRFPPRG